MQTEECMLFSFMMLLSFVGEYWDCGCITAYPTAYIPQLPHLISEGPKKVSIK